MDEMRSGIENTLYRYAWAYDMNELDMMAECFTLAAEVDFRDSGRKAGREAVASEMRRRRGTYDASTIPWHVITNVFITDAEPERAHARSWYTFFTKTPDGPPQLTSIGWYDDVFALEDGVWRIDRRRILTPHDD
jgi:hypothetical protein